LHCHHGDVRKALSSAPIKLKSSQELLSGKHGAGAKQGPCGQCAERAGGGMQAVLHQKGAAWAECTCAGARIGIPPSFVDVGALSFLSPRAARRGAARGSAMEDLGKGALHLSPPLLKPLQRRCTMYTSNSKTNPNYVGGAMYFCEAPL